MGEIAHVALDGCDGQAIVGGSLTVSLQLGFREIVDCDVGAQQTKGDGLLPSATGKTEDVFAADVPHHAVRVEQCSG